MERLMGQQYTISRLVLAVGALVGVAFAQGTKPSAATLSVKPLKVDIESQKTWQTLGEKATFDVVLKDAYNKPAKADRATPIIVRCLDAASTVVQQAEVQINKGESKTTWTCETKQLGPLRVEAKQKNNELLGGKAVTFITSPVKPPIAPRTARKSAQKPGALLLRTEVRFLAVAQTHGAPVTAAPFNVRLLGSETEALANGSSEAQFQVCFTQGDPAHPKTVVLYTHDGGTSNSRLEIPANQPCGAATLTSRTPGQVTVRIVSAAVGRLGTAAIDLPNQLTFTFHKIIADLRLDDPRSTMSLIESADLIARFYDENNHVTSAGENRVVTFSLAGAGLFQPQPIAVSANETEARTTLFPTYWGTARVLAATSTLSPTAPKIILVEVWQALILAIIGGAIGALISYAQFRDVLWWRVFVGVVTGLFLVWLASSGFITELSPTLVHNIVSGFFLALAGGYVGLPIIDWFLKLARLGSLRSEPSP